LRAFRSQVDTLKLQQFLRQAESLSGEDAERLLGEHFELGEEFRQEALVLFERRQEQKKQKLIAEPNSQEREELNQAGYEVKTKIGQGAGGFVYLVRQHSTGQLVAIKMPARSFSPAVEAHFRREIEHLTRVRHPNLIHLYDAGVTYKGRPYFVMEYVVGHDLLTYCKDRGKRLEERLQLMVEVCSAVAELNRQQVIHRDLKPQNVMVTNDGHPKIIDFGLAQVTWADWRDEWLARMLSEPGLSPDYAPPEQEDPRRRMDTSADCFALGRILLELLAGGLCDKRQPVPPSQFPVLADYLILGFGSDKALRDRYRGDLDAIVLRATAVEPGNRYRDAGSLGEDLKRYLEGRPVSAVPNTTAYETRLFVRRNPRWVAAVAFLVLSLAVTAIIALVLKTRAEELARSALESKTQAQEARAISSKFASALDEVVNGHYKQILDDASMQQQSMNNLYVELAKQFQEPETVQYTFVNRALKNMTKEDSRYSELDGISVSLAKKNGYPPRGSTFNLPPGITPLSSLQTLLKLTLTQIQKTATLPDLSSLRESVKRAAPFLKEDAESRLSIHDILCGSDASQRQLRSALPELGGFCK